MGFFDFLDGNSLYEGKPQALMRLERRRALIVEPYRAELADATVLDLAAHDGRWSYALADAGARMVHAVEGRATLVEQFKNHPPSPLREKIRMEHGDVFAALERMISRKRQLDVIACYGFFYHITDHYRLLTLMHQLRPKLIIIDSEFMNRDHPFVAFSQEKADNELNSLARIADQDMVMVGTPSRRWLESAAETLGYQTSWADWDSLPMDERRGLRDYFRDGVKRRGTVALRPLIAD